MGLLDKLKFWKKEEPAAFDMGKYPGLEAAPPGAELPGFAPPAGLGPEAGGLPGMPGEMPAAGGPAPHPEEFGPAPPPPLVRGPGAPAPSAFAPALAGPAAMPTGAAIGAAPDLTRDMQIVQAKLDTLKALLDSVISKLERIERGQQPKEEEAVPLSVRRWR